MANPIRWIKIDFSRAPDPNVKWNTLPREQRLDLFLEWWKGDRKKLSKRYNVVLEKYVDDRLRSKC